MQKAYTLGLDIGTTSISAVVAERDTGKVVDSETRKNTAGIPGGKCQDPETICTVAMALLEALLERYPQVEAIGLTGQMHGILYLDREGNPVSPLYTWQDQRSAGLCPYLTEQTGYPVAPGYGLATHCALKKAEAIPARAEKLCTIMDYLAFLLCGKENLLMHASNGASLGFFSLKDGCFDPEALEKVGIDPGFLPPVTSQTRIQGFFRGIPVAVAIGDNQASFLGSVAQPRNTALVNYGTGSQISRMVDRLPEQWHSEQVEVRPYLDGTYLLCGSALCGGRAYALLERFFRKFLLRSCPEMEDCYEILNQLAWEGLKKTDPLQIEPTFCGTRWDPGKRGSITNLGEDNFTPEDFATGTLLGMAEELRRLMIQMPGAPVEALAASGNAVRKNPALLEAIVRVFGIKAEICPCQEEAAAGAARFGAMAAEKIVKKV